MRGASNQARRCYLQKSSCPQTIRWLSTSIESPSSNGCNDDETEGIHGTKGEITTSFPEESAQIEDVDVSYSMKMEKELQKALRPSEVVKELDRHIVGQADAKRSVAIAMRNRSRRKQLPPDLKKEVTPRNVLMIGPTGCGKVCVYHKPLKN